MNGETVLGAILIIFSILGLGAALSVYESHARDGYELCIDRHGFEAHRYCMLNDHRYYRRYIKGED